MKISNETKVGVLVVVALTLLILGFNFLKGKNLFNNQKQLYAVFTDLGSLQKSNDVKINGLPIGAVYEYKEIDKNLSGIVVTINLNRDVNIPRNSVATIESELIGASYIDIKRGDASEFLGDGDTVFTERAGSLFGDVKAQVNPTLGKLRETLDSVKLVLGSINDVFDLGTKRNLQEIILNMKATTLSLRMLLDAENGSLAKTLKNTSEITANFKKNNDSITAVISSAKRAADKFANLDIQTTVDTMKATIAELKATLAKVNSKDGTLGALLNDRQMYNKLNDVLLSAEILVDDIRQHPKRYVNISVFGRKDKTGPLNSPLKKDSIPKSGNK